MSAAQSVAPEKELIIICNQRITIYPLLKRQAHVVKSGLC